MPQRVHAFSPTCVNVGMACVYILNLSMTSTFVCVRLSVRQKRGPLLGLYQHQKDEGMHVTSLQRAADTVRGEILQNI